MRPRVLLTVATLLLASCVSQEEPTATDAEIKAATDARDACFARRATSLDDGISDASVIGQAVYNACYKEIERLFSVVTRGRRSSAPDSAPLYVQKMQEQATSWVLSLRQLRRERRAGN